MLSSKIITIPVMDRVSVKLVSERQACPLDKNSEVISEQNFFRGSLVAVL